MPIYLQSTNAPEYASGTLNGGCLHVKLGGIDDADIIG
jgi:hypothetical protein